LLFVMLPLLGVAFSMRAGTISIPASERGSRASDGGGDYNPMGGYFAGRTTMGLTADAQWRDYFDFTIPVLSAPLLVPSCNSSRTMSLWRYAPTTRDVLSQ